MTLFIISTTPRGIFFFFLNCQIRPLLGPKFSNSFLLEEKSLQYKAQGDVAPYLPLLISFPLLFLSLPLLQPYWHLCCFIWSMFFQIMTWFSLTSSSLLYSSVTFLGLLWPLYLKSPSHPPSLIYLFHAIPVLFLILPFALIILGNLISVLSLPSSFCAFFFNI